MRNKKRISILLVLAMVMTMLTGLAAPAGATTPEAAVLNGSVVGNVPTVVNAGPVTLANIRYAEAGGNIGSIATGRVITVTLPSGIVFATGSNLADIFEASTGVSANITFRPSGNTVASVTSGVYDNVVEITLNRGIVSNLTAASFLIKLPAIRIGTPPTSGNVTAEVTTDTTAIAGGNFIVGRYGQGSLSLSVTGVTVPTVSRFTNAAQTVSRTIRVVENANGAFAAGTGNRVFLTLPEGVTWAAGTYTVTASPAGPTVTATRDTANFRRLNILINTGTTAVTTFSLVNPTIFVNPQTALGDLAVTMSGEGDNSAAAGSVVLARVADFSVTVRRQKDTNALRVTAGREGSATQLLQNLEIEEGAVGSLFVGGTVTVTLPETMRFRGTPTVAVQAGVITLGTASLESGYRTVRFNIGTPSTAAATIRISNMQVDVAPGAAAGDASVTVAGTAGASGTAVLGEVRTVAAVAAASVPRVVIGAAGQTAGDVTITESAFGRLVTGSLTFSLPAGVTWSGTPTVTRTAGNISLGATTITGNVLTVPVTASTVASTITLSGIRYNVDRTVADGNINVTVGGTSLVDATVAPNFPAVRVANAAVGEAARLTSVFTIGALSFVRDGVTTAIDAAPSIVEGRTLLPLRFAAIAVGVSEEDILWDPVRRTVTLLRGDRVVQLRIGDRNMTINGVVVPLEVPASIQNGRTVLPIRALGQALRANVAWDETARTVTVTAQ